MKIFQRTGTAASRGDNPSRGKGGFTIVELLVAMGIFTTLTTVTIGAFIQALNAQRALTYLMSVNNNAGSAIEQIAREARTGYRFCNPADFPPSGACNGDPVDTLTFTNYASDTVTYTREVDLNTSRGYITRNGAPITAEDVDVSGLQFTVRQAGNSKCSPWLITILMRLNAANSSVVSTETVLETAVSARIFPVEAPGVPFDVQQTCPHA
jgi:type II secretory pathway pseudopilin PulG